MSGTKAWYESKGVWGGVVAVAVIVMGVFGYTITPEDQEKVVLALTAIGAAAGSIVSVVGRYKATKRIR